MLPRLSLFANKIGLLDYSNKRKVHSVGRPLIGGISMAIGLSISCLLSLPLESMIGFYTGMIMVLIIGFLDDFKKLTPKLKLIAQILATSLVIYLSDIIILSFGNILSFGSVNLGIFAIPVSIICVVGVINAINMIDGVDGLAGSISLIAFISFGILAYINNQPEFVLLSVALSGVVIAFLKYNWHPSLLFMGDAGSFFLGYSLAFLSIAISQKHNSSVSPVVPLLILAVPIVDTFTVVIKRIINGKNPFTADKGHLHHILLRFGLNKKQVVLTIALITIVLSCFGIMGTIFRIPDYYLFSIFSAYFITYFTASFFIKKIIRLKSSKKRGWEHIKEEVPSTKTNYTMVNIQNKRTSSRYDKCLPFSCSMENENIVGLCELTNISYGGFSTKLNQFLSNGEHNINFILSENGKKASLYAKAVVVWMCRDNGFYRYGFKFTNMNEQKMGILKDLLLSYAIEV